VTSTFIDPGMLPVDYRASSFRRTGSLIVIEGVGGSGKSTLGHLLAECTGAQVLHTAPEPIAGMQRYVNGRCKALPHLLFYLAGALHVSDTARCLLEDGDVIIDRYVGSLLANHSAVLDTSIEEAETLIAPFRHYLLEPDITIYLDASAQDVAARTGARHHADPNARVPLTDTKLIETIRARFRKVADTDSTALVIDTHGKSPVEIGSHAQQLIRTEQ
jgi:thymidylate kinase